MKKIPSFTIDHIRLLRGIYVSRQDEVNGETVTTFDIRMKEPNREPALGQGALHTIEHLAATYLRNDPQWQDKIIYWGPMGCLTGNYLLMKGDLKPQDILALMQDMILSAIPALGFAMVFNVPHRALPWCALLGALGHGSRMVMMTAGFNIEWSTFMASLLVGCIGIQWSRWYLAHPKVFTVAAVIPMFPGISAYTAMISAVKIGHLGYSI